MTDGESSAERRKLAGDAQAWRHWGPYLAERAWGTVREDYSETGDAWNYLPHDHARSRVFRWSEDGLAGISDIRQTLCFAFAFWNGRDPILKERIFGLTGNEGNHGEDAKEYWWYVDSTPTHSWMRWRYLYPQAAFPYEDLVATNARRAKDAPEYELVDTGIFAEDRFFDISVDYAKADLEDLCIRLSVTNRGPEEATLSVLPTLWFRNTWSWGLDDRRPEISTGTAPGALVATHHELGTMVLSGEGYEEALFCDNETNGARLWGTAPGGYPKDAIGDHVISGAATCNPAQRGTKAALHYRLMLAPGATTEVRLRLATVPAELGETFTEAMTGRKADADEFYAELTPSGTSADEAMVMRQAFGGMLWSKQYYHYNVERWLEGDPAQPPPPPGRLHGRNADWWHLNNRDILSMPDKWEYPWFAAWDLGFHCVTLAHVDPDFAKHQLVLICREWYMHPNGQLPAYEWAFGDVNPPVHAWAALNVFLIDGGSDYAFLEAVFAKLLINFTWWVNRKDAAGNNVFEGGFLGLDNIGPIDRSAQLPVDGILEQSDGTAWMAMYCLHMLQIAIVLSEHDGVWEQMASKFLEHFAYIASALNDQGLWNEDDGFYYDVLKIHNGPEVPLRVRSMVGLLPICASTVLSDAMLERLPWFADHYRWFVENKPEHAAHMSQTRVDDGNPGTFLSIVAPDRLRRILGPMLSEEDFLSPNGLRALSRWHLEHPFTMELAGTSMSVNYEPAESTSGLFGGNSNWRGPVWFPVNYLLVQALRCYSSHFGRDFTVEMPTGSGQLKTLEEVADDLAGRLVGIFLNDPSGRRPVFGPYEMFQSDPELHDLIPFHEYFHGDTGQGLGASHQTGWTGLVADLIATRRPKP